jgi:FemAB-related protein (PEP-CTERM system-associated)
VGFATGGGIVAESDSVAAQLAQAGWDLARKIGSASMELRGGPLPEGWHPQQGTYANFERELLADADAMLNAIPKRQRSEVKRALRADLQVTIGADQRHRAAHFRVYSESVRNLGTPVFPARLFSAALDEFGTDAEVIVIWQGERPLAALLNFVFRESYQPFWGGGTTEARTWRANDLIYYAALRRGIEFGCTRADFGRSKVGTGPWQRKRIWGFTEKPLVYGVRAAGGRAPREINPLDPKYRLKIAAWQKMPLWVANGLGPVIARGLG